MTNYLSIQNFISSRNDSYCDDCLSEGLYIKPRKQVNQICNKLKKQNFLKREVKQCSNCSKEKLVNIKS